MPKADPIPNTRQKEQGDLTPKDGALLANGAYIYLLAATDGTNTFDPSNTESAKGIVFVNR
jgi:hypothetical protein